MKQASSHTVELKAPNGSIIERAIHCADKHATGEALALAASLSRENGGEYRVLRIA